MPKSSQIQRKTPPPPRAAAPPLNQPVQNSLWRTMAEGLAFGTGSSIARETISRTLSNVNSTLEPKQETTSDPTNLSPTLPIFSECHYLRKKYFECLAE